MKKVIDNKAIEIEVEDIEVVEEVEEAKEINSYELSLIINEFREEEGVRSPLRYYHLLSRLRRDERILNNMGMYELESVEVYGRKRKVYMLNEECIEFLFNMTTDSDRVPLQKVYEELGGDHRSVNYQNRFEDEFMSKLGQFLKELDLTLIREYNVLGYLVDGYIPEINLVVEYDEMYHSYEKQKESDAKRQNRIIEEINCGFIRLDYDNTDATNIGIVMKEILKFINE